MNEEKFIKLKKMQFKKVHFNNEAGGFGTVHEKYNVVYNYEKKGCVLVEMSVKILNDDEDYCVVDILLCGEFLFNYLEESEKKLIERTATAFLFPYLRSQVTAATSVPGVEPIVLPIMNISKFIELTKV